WRIRFSGAAERLAGVRRSVYRDNRRGVAQPGSASALGAEGRRFESCRPDQVFCYEKPMTARIYKPAKTAMQSGQANTKDWVLEFEPEEPRNIEPLMGWTSSGDMKSQVRLDFASKEDAVAYAERNGIAYQLFEPKPVKRRIMSYSDNFAFNRRSPWT